MKSAIFVEHTKNSKLSREGGPKVSATQVSISSTCPNACAMKDNGCYAQMGRDGLTVRRLDAAKAKPSEAGKAEARVIACAFPDGVPQDGARGGRDLRLHVSGDAANVTHAKGLARSVKVLKARGLGSAWTYTHRWRTIPAKVWGPIATLASCDSPSELPAAFAAGYVPALTVARFEKPTAYPLGDFKLIPCPAQTRDVKCIECRLCIDRHDTLRAQRAVIGFALHGPGAKRRLQTMRGEP